MNIAEYTARYAAQLREIKIQNPDGTLRSISEKEVQQVLSENLLTIYHPSSLSGLIGNDRLPFEIEVCLDEPQGPRLYLREDFHDGDVRMDLSQVERLREALGIAVSWMKTPINDRSSPNAPTNGDTVALALNEAGVAITSPIRPSIQP